jgi:hypothetical protein
VKAAALALVLVLSLCACATTRHGVVQGAEVQPQVFPRQVPQIGGPMDLRPKVVPAPVPTGYVIVKTDDGTGMRCRSAFANLEKGARVTIRETSPGEWAVTSVGQ